MQQRRLGLQTWPVSMETGEGGEPHLLVQVVGPQIPSAILPPSWGCVWWGEDLSTYCPPPHHLVCFWQGWTMGKGAGGTEMPKGVWIPGDLGSLSPCSPVWLGETSAPHTTPQIQAYVPLYALPPQHEPGETDDCAPCSQREALRKLGGRREDLGRSQEWTGTGELGERDIKRDSGGEMDTVQNQVEADTNRETDKDRDLQRQMRKQMGGNRATELLSEGDREPQGHREPDRDTFGKPGRLRDKDQGDTWSRNREGWGDSEMGRDFIDQLHGMGTESWRDQKCLQSYSSHLNRLRVWPKGRDID